MKTTSTIGEESLNCETCKHLEPCSKEYGGLDKVENCSVVIGTHLCLASWSNLKCCKQREEPKMKELTCFWCKQWIDCKCSFDPYNTHGDCLASK